MKILIIGSGAREHALAWKLAQSPNIKIIFVAPGNGGTALDKRFKNIAITNLKKLANFAETEHINFTIVGSEIPLAAGIVNLFIARGLKIFGPSQKAAQLESSKYFAKIFMKRHNIPTAEFQTFSETKAACEYVKKKGVPIVIKADGLAAGKGVTVATTLIEAYSAINMMLSLDAQANKFDHIGARIIIEDFLIGEEVSFIVMVDGKNILPLATSQDYKRLYDYDKGPNTGGMGACSPAPIVSPVLYERIIKEIITPAVHGMIQDDIPFSGFLYAGLIINDKGNIQTLEFNCRMGDPETQAIMPRLKTDFLTVMQHAINGTLNTVTLDWDYRVALCVVIAASGYPYNSQTGNYIINIPAETSNYIIFHAGTILQNNKLTVSGGRVMCVVGLGETFKVAKQQAYTIANMIHFNGAQMRHDIGWRVLKY